MCLRRKTTGERTAEADRIARGMPPTPPPKPPRGKPTPLVGDTPINQALPRLGPNQMTAQSFIGWMDTAGCKGRTVARSFVGLVISVLGTARL